MQAQITLLGDVKTIAAVLALVATNGPSGITGISTSVSGSDAPKKRGRPAKAKEVETNEFDEECEVDEAEAEQEAEDEADEETEETEDDIDEAPPAKVKKAKVLSLEADMIPAFQAYAKKHSREKAGKILNKFKVKAVRDLPPAKFPEILALLKG